MKRPDLVYALGASLVVACVVVLENSESRARLPRGAQQAVRIATNPLVAQRPHHNVITVPAAPQYSALTPVEKLKKSRCTVLFVLGVEGSGHHGVVPAIVEASRTFKDHIALTIIDDAPKSSRHVVKWMSKCTRLAQQDPHHVLHMLVISHSFPYFLGGRYDKLKTQSDPLNVIQGFAAYRVTEMVDSVLARDEIPKVILLKRPLLASVTSHPKLDTTPLRHLWVLTQYSKHLNNEIQSRIHNISLARLDFNRFKEHCEEVMPRLAKFLEFGSFSDKAQVPCSSAKFTHRDYSNGVPKRVIEAIQAAESEGKLQWPVYYSDRYREL